MFFFSTSLASVLTHLPQVAFFTLDGPSDPSWFPSGYTLHAAFDAQYELCGKLGKGGNGFVMQARRRSDGCHFAVKFLKMKSAKHWPAHPRHGPIPWDVAIAIGLDHENLIKPVRVFNDEQYFYLVSGVSQCSKCTL